jgi:glycosyltransferase involved in cell wall biosynthesis
MSSDPPPGNQSKLRVLYIAYPLLPVSEHSAGGAEQVLWTLEREINARGYQTTVAACAGSQVAGKLFATGDAAEVVDQFEARSSQQTQLLLDWLQSGAAWQFDLIHDMSGGFWPHAQNLPLPLLATLHLPRSLYQQVNFSSIPVNVSFNCVSKSQTTEFHDLLRVLGVASNGIALDRFPAPPAPREEREYLLWLGRICEEKGTHTALDVAYAAGKKLIVAGSVYPLLYHQKYFAREIIPRLKRAGNQVKYVERPSFAEKVDLIRNAQALLITTEIDETSSIVAMEAAACGTPVVAFRRGALPEVVAEGVTGFLVQDVAEMVSAIPRTREIDSEQSRRHAQQHYSAARMAEAYAELYRIMLSWLRPPSAGLFA